MRVMAAHQTLTLKVQVRVLLPQPNMEVWRNRKYATDLKSVGRNTVWVQVPLPPPITTIHLCISFFFIRQSDRRLTNWKDSLTARKDEQIRWCGEIGRRKGLKIPR